MYAAAALVGAVESLVAGPVPGDFMAPVAALVVATVLVWWGHRLPRYAHQLFAPLGTVLIAVAIVVNTSGEGALLYMWPAVFAAYFSSRPVLLAGLVWIGAVHGTVVWFVLDDPHAFDEFFDVITSAAVVTGVVVYLRERNAGLVARLRHEARTDALTGLLNRRAFHERLEAEVARSRRTGEPLSLAILDADHFKEVNDRRGHAAGDALLATLADVLRAASRRTDEVARIGGEEFAAVLPGSTLEGGEEFAARVHAALAAEGEITVSVGIAEAEPDSDADALLRRADDALYRAKRDGRSRTVVAGAG
jgi:diguanylate cyclase (GGDEF)-like protein